MSVKSQGKNKVEYKFTKKDLSCISMINTELVNNSEVIFSSYTINHPLEKTLILRIETSKISPEIIFQESIDKLIEKLEIIEYNFSNLK